MRVDRALKRPRQLGGYASVYIRGAPEGANSRVDSGAGVVGDAPRILTSEFFRCTPINY